MDILSRAHIQGQSRPSPVSHIVTVYKKYLEVSDSLELFLNLLDFLDQPREERLYSMLLEEEPQSGPDRHLGFQVETLLYKLVQGFYVNRREGQAYTLFIDFVDQFTFHPFSRVS